jgi:hypothetical protein
MNSTNDNDNTPNNKVTIKDEFQDYFEIEKNKDYIISKFGGTSRTLLSTIISSIYTLIFFILLLYYNEYNSDSDEFEKDIYNNKYDECRKLRRWNRVLYIGLGISFLFFIICTVLQIKNQGKEKYVSILLLIRTVFNYIIGLFFLISITSVYFGISGDVMDNCPSVKKVDLAYIICEWAIFSVCIIFHYAIVIFFVCCKAKRKPWNGEGEVDPEEIKKVI